MQSEKGLNTLRKELEDDMRAKLCPFTKENCLAWECACYNEEEISCGFVWPLSHSHDRWL